MTLQYTECEVPAERLYIIFHPQGNIFHENCLENQMCYIFSLFLSIWTHGWETPNT